MALSAKEIIAMREEDKKKEKKGGVRDSIVSTGYIKDPLTNPNVKTKQTTGSERKTTQNNKTDMKPDTVLFKPGTASKSFWKTDKSFDRVLDTQKKAREEQSKSRKAYADFARDILSDMGAFGRTAGEMRVKKANNRLSDDEAISRLGKLSFEDVTGLYRKNKDYEKYLSDNASGFDYNDWIDRKTRTTERNERYKSLLNNLTPTGKAATGDEGLSDEAYRFKMDNLTEADAKSYANFYEKKASEKNIDYPDRVRYKSIADIYRDKYINIKYESIKNNPDFEEKSKRIGYDASGLPVDARPDGAVLDKTEKYALMTSNEREIYYYLKNTKGSKEAENYLKFIEPKIDKRYSGYAVQKAEAVGREHPVAATVISIASSPANAVGAFVDNAKAAVTGKVNELDYLSVNQKSALREGVMNEHIKSKAGQIIYSSFTSAVDNALNALVAKGLVGATALSGAAKAKAIGRIGGALMESEAAASGILAGKANGMSDRGAVAYGIAQGVIELLTEKYSIEKIMGESGTVVRTFLKNSFTEGSEEIASYWANMVLDEIAGQGVEKKYKGLIAQGYSAEEASKQIVTDIVYGNLESFIGGALAGGMMSAGTTLPGVISAGGVKNYNKQLELANQYNSMSEEERKEFDRKMAAEQAANVLSGDKVGPVEVATALDALGVPEPDKAAKAIENFKDTGKTSERLHNDARVADVMEMLNERGYFKKADSVEKQFDEESGIELEKDFEDYPYNQQTVLDDYVNSVNDEVVKNLNEVKQNKNSPFKRISLGTITDKAAGKIKQLTGFDVKGYSYAINSNALKHIEKRHGENGIHDKSMAKAEDVARVGYVINNYDSMELLKDEKGNTIYSHEFKGKDGKRAPMLTYTKKINGTYYSVIAAAENGYKKLWVVTAYISKNKEDVTQVLHDEISSLGATSENELASPTSDDSVAQQEGKVKGENENFRNETKKSDYVPPIKVNTSNENDRNMVKTITDGIGKEGRRAYHERIELEYTAGYNGNKAVFLRDFNAFYTKGFTGGKISEVNSRFSDRLTLGTRRAAFKAGQADRAAAIDAKYTEANRAVIRDGGLILNHNTEGREDIKRLDELGKKFGVSIEIQDTVVNSRGNEVNGLYSQGEIKISKKAVDSFKSPEAAERFILGHELLHRVETLAPKLYVNLRERIYDYVQRQNSAEITAAENAVLKKDVDMDTAIDEIAADYIGNEKFALDTAMHDLTLAEKIRGMARDILDVLGIKKYSEAERIARVWEKACEEAKRSVKKADSKVGNDVKREGEVKYSIVTLSNGMKYVQADEQVTSGNDPKKWEQQIINYVNKKVRHGNDVVIPMSNGEEIKITGRTAWKLGYRNGVNEGKPINTTLYSVKGNASGVIDEIIQTSVFVNKKENKKQRTFGSGGFEYRKAFFRDLDGRYYQLTLSVGVNDEGKEAYNIGIIKKIQFPHGDKDRVMGSKARGTVSDNSIPQTKSEVNTSKQNNSEKSSTGDLNEVIRENEASEGKISISEEDIKAIQSIGQKSINDFTSDDIKTTEAFAKKYFKEMGVKSPFFRAWFGDWRANDNTPVKTVNVETIDLSDAILKNGDYYVPDTKWTIHAGKTLREETKHYAREEKISVKALTAIKDILDNAVLLDTEVSERSSKNKSINTAFMHKLYCPLKYNNADYIAKVSIEEFLNPSNNIERKAYHLQSIKIETADGHAIDKNISTSMSRSDTVSINTVSQLFEIVKQNDKNFQPKESSKVVNEDGTPKVVYHGTSNGGFNTFDIYGGNFGLFGEGAYFTENSQIANEYTNKGHGSDKQVYACYLDIKNPIDMDAKADINAWEKALNEIDEISVDFGGVNTNEDAYRAVLEELEYNDYGRYEAYDFVNSLMMEHLHCDGITHIGGGRRTNSTIRHRVWIAFDSTQIKSATDNRGTFDRNNADIRYSSGDLNEVIKENEKLKKENEKLKELKDHYKGQMLRSPNQYAPSSVNIKKVVNKVAKGYRGSLDLAEEFKKAQGLLSKCIASSGKGNTDSANEIYNQYKEKIDFIAGDIANNTRWKNDSLYREYRSIKDSLKGVTVKVDESWVNDLNGKNGYSEFKKRNFGTVRMSLSSGTPIDVLYNELGGRFGELFPEEIVTGADQLIYITDLLKSMSDFYENPYNGDMDAAIEGISETIDLELLALSGERTQADKYFDEAQKQIEAANAERDEAIKSSRERYNQKIEAFKAEQRQKRADNARKKEEMSARQKLLTLSRRMKRIAKNGKTTQANQALINELIGHVDTISVSMTDRTVRNLESLSAWYQEAAKRINFVPNPRIEEDLARLDEEKIGEMDIKRVIALTEALQNIEKQIEIADKEIGKKGNVYEKGMNTIENIKNSGGAAAYGLGHIKDSIITGLINPVNAIHRITGYNDNDALYQTTRDLRDAETVEMYHEMRANKLFEKYNTDKKFMKHLKEDFKVFNVKQYDKFGKETGEKTVRLNPAMIISLAQLAKNNSSLLHMTEGGVRIADEELYKRGKYKEAFDRGFVVKIVAPEIKKITETLTEQDKAYMKMVETYFNEIAKQEINAVSQELDGVDRARVGFYFPMNTDSAFLVKEFDSIAYDKSVENMGSLKERITRAKNPLLLMAAPDVVSRAIKNNGRYIAYAIPLRNFKKLWNTMSHGDLVQVPDRDKYGNVRVDENGETVMKDVFTSNFDASIKDTVQKVWGQNAVDYVENFINDIETGRNEKTSKVTKWINKRHSKYIKAVLSQNLPIVVNQVASYPSAAAVLGWEPLLKALTDFGKVDLELISKYTAVQWNRTKGGYDPTVADAYESGGKLSKFSDWLMLSDAIITRKLWKASEYYIRQHNPDLKIGTDEYYRAVGKIYEKVMQETQPNSGIMERPEVLRSDSFTRFAMPFTGEPLKNVNLIYDAIGNVQAKKRQLDRVAGTEAQQDAEKRLKEAKQYAVRVLASQLVANIAFNVFVSVAKIAFGGRAGRKKYEDEEGNITLASYFMELGKDIVLNTVTQVPFTSDIIDLISAMANDEMKYYAPNMISVQAITDAAEALINTTRLIQKAIRSEAGTWKEIVEEVNYNLVKASTYAGVALKNYENIANSLTYWVTKVIYHDNKTMQKYVMEKLSGAIVERTKDEETGEFVYKPTKEAKALLYNAFKNGENDNYETILFDLVDDGVKASDLESAMRSFSQKDEKFNIESSLGAAAGVKKGVDYELYEKYLEKAEKAEVSEEDLKNGIDIIESGKPYKKMYEEITSFTSGMTEKQIAFFDKIARGKYTPDELGTKEYKEFSEKRGQTVGELENQLDTSGLGNKEMNDIYNKIYQYAENVALEEASDGEYIINTKWINEAKKSQETIGVNTAEFIRLYNKYDSKVYSTETIITKELGYDIKLSLEYSRLKSIKGTDSERDENGQIIKGKSKQDKVIAIIDSMDITDEEKAYLFGIEYKSNDNNKWARSQKVNYKKYVEERKNAK